MNKRLKDIIEGRKIYIEKLLTDRSATGSYKSGYLDALNFVDEFISSNDALREDEEMDCDCHMQVGGSGEPCPDCKKNGCGFCKPEDAKVSLTDSEDKV